MFGKKKQPVAPEVQQAESDRDALLEGVENVVAAAAKVRDEILEQYEEAEGRR